MDIDVLIIGDCIHRQPEMATETRSRKVYVFGIITVSVKIPTLAFSTTRSSKEGSRSRLQQRQSLTTETETRSA